MRVRPRVAARDLDPPAALDRRRERVLAGDRERDRVVVAVLEAAGEAAARRRSRRDITNVVVPATTSSVTSWRGRARVQDLDRQPRRDLRRPERRQRVVERVRRAAPGSSSVLAPPVWTVSATGSGDGHSHGQ